VTIAASAYLILYNGQLYERLRGEWLSRLIRAPAEPAAADDHAPLKGHVIVVGVNSLGRQLIQELRNRGETVLAVDTDPSKLARLDCATLLGSIDHPTVLEEANFHAARLVVSALQIEDTNNLLAYRCRKAGVPSSIHAFEKSVVEELRRIGVNHLMMPRHNGIRRMVGELRRRGVVTE
jgi:Trk K+ transport system NAD-binding subunit